MSKQKSVTVTVIIAVLAGVGFWSAAVNLCSWLEAESFTPEEAVEPLEIGKHEEEEYDA